MPSSKYERELRFIDNEVHRMRMQLDALAEAMPADPAEAQEKARTVTELQDKIAGFLGRKAEIEESFKAAGMELPDIGRSMNATVHNASGFEVHSPRRPSPSPAPTPAPLPHHRCARRLPMTSPLRSRTSPTSSCPSRSG